MMLFAGALALLLGSSAASADEEGWEVYRKARPKLALKSAAVARVLVPFGQVPEPPLELDYIIRNREDLLKIINVTLEGGPTGRDPLVIQNLYLKSTDRVLLTGRERYNNGSYIDLTGISTFEPEAALFYDDVQDAEDGSERLRVTVKGGTIYIGAPDGEFVNFAGSLWMVHPDRKVQGAGSYGLIIENANAHIDGAVFYSHQSCLLTLATNEGRSSTEATNLSFLESEQGLGVVAEVGEALVHAQSEYFRGNNHPLYGGRGTVGDRGESIISPGTRAVARLENAFFDAGQSPLPGWDADSLGRENYARIFTISEPNPTVNIGQVTVTQTWPREVLFAPEDFDRNGSVGITDLVILTQSFEDSSRAVLFGDRFDLNIDGVIDLPDILDLAYAFAGISRTEPIAALSASPRMPEFLATLVQYPAIRDAAEAEALADPDGFGAMVQSYIQRTAVAEVSDETPAAFSLGQNYPNPFNAETAILYQIAEEADVRVTVYDMLGRRVATLVAEHQLPGTYRATWDGLDNGQSVASGTYFYRLVAGAFTETRRMTLLR
ncbi:T9SS type A sorting domain-containing protein [Candidatus Berkelbacteria bacterium]|nr:T9SS type A sorting domain-containing protein [Candidatus Berkelbacteria bacterium]